VGNKGHILPAPGRGPASSAVSASTSAQGETCAGGQLCYHGGSVMTVSQTYAIYWLAPGCHFESLCSGSSGPNSTDGQYESIVNSYLPRVGNTSFYNILTQYSVSGQTIQNSSTFGGYCVDATPYSEVGGGSAGTSASPLIDSDLEAEIANALSVCHWSGSPPSVNGTTAFFIFTGLDVESCFDSSHSDCSATDTNGNADYCAYYSYNNLAAAGSSAIYSNIPDMSAFCNAGSYPSGDSYADNVRNIASHEHFESVSDPFLTAWYDASGLEIGDKCAWQFGASGSSVALDGTGFRLQEEYSNADANCVLSYATPLRSGQSSLTIWRSSTGVWYGKNAIDGSPLFQTQWGLPGDKPLLADFTDAGRKALAVPVTSLEVCKSIGG
jgi:hypothetical protein